MMAAMVRGEGEEGEGVEGREAVREGRARRGGSAPCWLGAQQSKC